MQDALKRGGDIMIIKISSSLTKSDQNHNHKVRTSLEGQGELHEKKKKRTNKRGSRVCTEPIFPPLF